MTGPGTGSPEAYLAVVHCSAASLGIGASTLQLIRPSRTCEPLQLKAVSARCAFQRHVLFLTQVTCCGKSRLRSLSGFAMPQLLVFGWTALDVDQISPAAGLLSPSAITGFDQSYLPQPVAPRASRQKAKTRSQGLRACPGAPGRQPEVNASGLAHACP